MTVHALRGARRAFPCHYSPTGIAVADPDGRSCTCKTLRLTKAQARVLPRIEPGCAIHDIATKTLNALQSLGLIELFEDPPHHPKSGPSIALIGFRKTQAGEAAAARLRVSNGEEG